MGNFALNQFPWSFVPLFMELARKKSLSAAARSLKIDRTTVARRLDQLEEHLSCQLFDRQRGEFILTLQGRELFAAAERAAQELSVLGTEAGDAKFAKGKVRLSLSEHLLAAIPEIMIRFSELHPDILLEMATSDRHLNLKRFEADVTLRISRTSPVGLYSRKVGPIAFRVYQRSVDTGPVTRFLTTSSERSIPNSILLALPEIEVFACVDGVLPAREMVKAGAGAALLPRFLGDKDPDLEACSNDIDDQEFFLFLNCLPEQRNLHRIRVLFQFLERELKQFLALT
ncbi:MAG: LysR family transcriptional regulator [Roseibium sp.]